MTLSHTSSCALCGHEQTLDRFRRPARIGLADLDTRGGGGRDYPTQFCCERCGYVAPDLCSGGPVEKAVVLSQLYQIQLNHPEFPSMANQMLCRDLLAQVRQRWDEGFWHCLYAAWVCDDAGLIGSARQCRLWALNRLGQAQAKSLRLTEQTGGELLLRLDLLRRSGRFSQARRLLDRDQPRLRGGMAIRIGRYQAELLNRQDDSAHNLADMERWEAVSGLADPMAY